MDQQTPRPRVKRAPQNHRTVDRVTKILEQVVYKPGMTFAELVRVLDAAKSSVHGFIQGLVAQGWLYEADHRFYLGPAVYALTMASGHIRAGQVTQDDLMGLHEATGVKVFLGVRAGDHLIYVAEAGSNDIEDFDARSNIRRTLLRTAGGKALLATLPDTELRAYLRGRPAEEAELVQVFVEECESIRATGIAVNIRHRGTRFGLATTVRKPDGHAVASITLVGTTAELQPRREELSKLLLQHVGKQSRRPVTAREAI